MAAQFSSTSRGISIRPTFFYRQRFPKGYTISQSWHSHNDFEIMYVDSGRCTFSCGKKEWTLPKNCFILLGKNVYHGMEVREEECRIINVQFELNTNKKDSQIFHISPNVSKWTPLDHLENGCLVLKDDDLAIHSLLMGIVTEMNQNRWGETGMVQFRIWELLITIGRLHHESQIESEGTRIVWKVKEYFSHHYSDPLNMELVAKAVGISRGYLHKVFRQELGITPNEYLTELRLQRAKALLAGTDFTLVEVALRIGLESQQQLHVLFRKYLQMTPGEYRRSKRTRVTINDKLSDYCGQIHNTEN